jgi:hypothetical protein
MDEETKRLEEYLKGMGSKGSYEVPNAYFNALEANILNRLPQHTYSQKAKILPLHWFSAAAILLLCLSVIYTYMQKKEKTGHRLIDNEFVLDQLGRTELNADLLCEAGWCLELEQLPFMGDSTLRVDDWYFMESDLLIDEL